MLQIKSASIGNITIELMFAGVNMFLSRLRLILARAAGEARAKMSSEKVVFGSHETQSGSHFPTLL